MAALKRDYYAVLGVPRDADEDTIRRAFHREARIWHPDVTDAPEAEERFRTIAQAYSVLSSREGRLLYDRYGYEGPARPTYDDDASPLGRGEDVLLDLELRDFEAAEGARRVVTYDALHACVECDGDDASCKACAGEGQIAVQRRVRLLVPPGIADDSLLRGRGEGHQPGGDGMPGDLLVKVRVAPPPRDPRGVRLVALILMLIAVAALVLYLAR